MEVSEQLVAGSVATHVAPAPSLTVTVPVGAPAPAAETLKVTVTGFPNTTGFGVIEEMVVVVLALFTAWAKAVEVLAAKPPLLT